MNTIKRFISPMKRFAAAHKVGIALATAAAFCYVANRNVISKHDNFLRENGLYDEFYATN